MVVHNFINCKEIRFKGVKFRYIHLYGTQNIYDIAVLKSEELVFSSYHTNIVNILRDKKAEILIFMQFDCRYI